MTSDMCQAATSVGTNRAAKFQQQQQMDDDEDVLSNPNAQVDDLLDQSELLPATAPSFTAHPKYTRLFAVDCGAPGHDQYVYALPNGLCVVGLAPSHRFLQSAAKPPPCSPMQPAQQAEGVAALHDLQPEQVATLSAAVVPAQLASADSAPAQQATNPPSQPAQQPTNPPSQPASTPVPLQPQDTPQQDSQPDSAAAKRKADVASQAGPSATGTDTGTAPTATPAGNKRHKTEEQPTAASSPPSAAAGAAGGSGAAAQAGTGRLSVCFDVSGRDSSLKQSGKKRGQGAHMEPSSVLCVIQDGGGSTWVGGHLRGMHASLWGEFVCAHGMACGVPCFQHARVYSISCGGMADTRVICAGTTWGQSLVSRCAV